MKLYFNLSRNDKFYRFGLLFLILIISFFAYLPILNNKFQLNWDDQWMVINSYTSLGFKLFNISDIFLQYYNGQYGPINQLYYNLIFLIFGYNPFWFHLFSLLIHLINVLLVFFFIEKFLLMSHSFDKASCYRIALITAFFLGIHPFMVEAVAWISASKIILYAFFYLFSLLFYLKFKQTQLIRNYIFSILLFTLSFGSKEQAVTLPICLILIDYFLGANLKNWNFWLEKTPFLVLSIFFGLITMYSQQATNQGILSKEMHSPLYQSIIYGLYSFTEYITKCLLPIKLSYAYPFPNILGQSLPNWYWVYPILILPIIFLLFRTLRNKWIFFGLLFFTIHIALVLHIIPLSRNTIVADRYVYVASIGIFFCISYGINYLVSNSKLRIELLTVLAVYILGLGIYTFDRARDWYDSKTLKANLKELIRNRDDYQPKKIKNEQRK